MIGLPVRRSIAGLCVGLAVMAAAADAVEPERGAIGFSIEVDGDGFFFNPTLRTVTVTAVAAGSPAAGAGIAVGDRIVAADGHVVAGSKARDLEPTMQKRVGEALHLRLKRPDGTEYAVTLIAVAKSPEP